MIGKEQKPTTIDVAFHERYRVMSGIGTMASMHRSDHALYLDTYDLRGRVQRKLRRCGVGLTDVELVSRLLRMVLYNRITIVVNDDGYSNAG